MKDRMLQFSFADSDPDPVCLQNKYWQLIKMDFTEWLSV